MQSSSGRKQIKCFPAAAVSAPPVCRFNPNTGLVTLTCNTHEAREDNRREVLQIVMNLVSEGHREYPAAELEHDQQLSARSA